MTLAELKTRVETIKIPYCYGARKKEITAPYINVTESDSNNFVADNVVYKKIKSVELAYTYKNKNLETEEQIENNVLYDVVWRKGDETYVSDEDVWQIVYYFNRI